jgi:hypothetical protein
MTKKTAAEIELKHDRAVASIGVAFKFDQLVKAYTVEAHRRWQESDIVVAINEHLITREQIDWLAAHNLTLEELLRGEFRASDHDEVERTFCQKWNAAIGVDVFGFPEEDK